MQSITIIGLDLAKSVFEIHGVDGNGANAAVLALWQDGVPIKQIVRRTGLHRMTVRRIVRGERGDVFFDQAIVVTNAEYRFTVLDQLQAIGITAQIVLEPARRDSAAAVATATELALARDERAIVGVFAADHVVQDGALFVETCRQAGVVAAQGS